MGRRGRADQARGVGAGGGQRQQHGLEQRPRDGMGGDADRDRVEPGGRDPGQGRAVRLRQDQGQRPRPERRRHRRRPLVEAGDGARPGKIGDMDDQRVVRRAALGAVDAGHRGVAGGDRTQAVDGLGREGDQPAPAQEPAAAAIAAASGGRMRLSAQARSRFSPASAATATRASLTASPRRKGSTPSVTAFSAPTKVASQPAPRR